MSRAKFTIIHSTPSVVLLIDNKTSTSVTNDAEAVVDDILARHKCLYAGNPRIFYRDTDDRWDELKHDGHAFTGFAPLPISEDPELIKLFEHGATFKFDELLKNGRIVPFTQNSNAPHRASAQLVRLARKAAVAHAKAAEANRAWVAQFEAEFGHNDISDVLVEAIDYSNGNTSILTSDYITQHSKAGQS